MIKINVLKKFGNGKSKSENEFTKTIDAMLEDMPIRQLVIISNGVMTPSAMEGLVDIINASIFVTLRKWKNKVYLRIKAINF